jgi:hypothetical protein
MKHNRTLPFGSTLLKHDPHFDHWNQPLNMRMRVCDLNCHEDETVAWDRGRGILIFWINADYNLEKYILVALTARDGASFLWL